MIAFGIRVAGHDQSCEGKTAVITAAPLYMLQTIVIPFAAKFGVGAVFVAIIGLIWDKVKAFLNPLKKEVLLSFCEWMFLSSVINYSAARCFCPSQK